MKTKAIIVVTAIMMLFGVSANAQSGTTPIKGDVNEDGVVDVADIVAVINIMMNGGSENKPKDGYYYWYIGPTDPTTMSTITPIVDNTPIEYNGNIGYSPGWRLIGDELPSYSISNMLWNGADNPIMFGGRTEYYIALPSSSLKLYNSGGDNEMDGCTSLGTKTINNVTYYIYKRNVKVAAFAFNIY